MVALEAVHPDLLLVDFLIFHFRGDALTPSAIRGRESLRNVPVLVITASRSDDVINQLLPIGDVAVAFKPVSPEDPGDPCAVHHRPRGGAADVTGRG